MRVLHETLPCSRNFFSMKRKYRVRQNAKNEEEPNNRESKIREIASPRIVRGLSLGKSPVRRQSSRGISVESGSASFQDASARFSSMQSPADVRVKKNKSREHVRNSSR